MLLPPVALNLECGLVSSLAALDKTESLFGCRETGVKEMLLISFILMQYYVHYEHVLRRSILLLVGLGPKQIATETI